MTNKLQESQENVQQTSVCFPNKRRWHAGLARMKKKDSVGFDRTETDRHMYLKLTNRFKFGIVLCRREKMEVYVFALRLSSYAVEKYVAKISSFLTNR